MTQPFDRRLWLAVGALGAALLWGGSVVLSQAPARSATPAAHRVTLSREPAPTGGALAAPELLIGGAEEPAPAPAASRPTLPAAVPAIQQPGSVAPAAPDRCMAVLGQGRPQPMCAPLGPQP